MMTDLFEKSIATLELPRVLEQLAACASTQEGKERCLALRPMTDPDDVQRAQEETSAAVEMLIKRGSPGFSGVKPVGASLHRADMGGSLNTRELLEVAAVLRCARTVQDYGAGEEKPPISHLFRPYPHSRAAFLVLIICQVIPDIGGQNILRLAAASDGRVPAIRCIFIQPQTNAHGVVLGIAQPVVHVKAFLLRLRRRCFRRIRPTPRRCRWLIPRRLGRTTPCRIG